MSKLQDKVIILLLNFNGYPDTLECLKSLEKVTYLNFQTIVIDNGSNNDSVSKIREKYPDIPILETGKNHGFAGGNNFGIEWALSHKADWVLLLNNDTIVSPNFLDAFMDAAKEQPSAGVLGAKILKYSTPEVIDHLGGNWSPSNGEFFSPHSNEHDHPYLEMEIADYVCGACMLIRRDVIEKTGLLEPKFFLFWEETDYCYRAKKEGFEIWTAPKATIWHKVSSSFSGGKPHMHYFWWRSRLLWIQRNCSPNEKKALYRKILIPEMWKMFRHMIIKSFVNTFSKKKERKEKIRRYKAGCAGIIDFMRGKFGNCPNWILKK